jgi:hypothetical protein
MKKVIFSVIALIIMSVIAMGANFSSNSNKGILENVKSFSDYKSNILLKNIDYFQKLFQKSYYETPSLGSFTLRMQVYQTGNSPETRKYILLDTTVNTTSFSQIFSGSFLTRTDLQANVYVANLYFTWSGDGYNGHAAHFKIYNSTIFLDEYLHIIDGQTSGQLTKTLSLNLSQGTNYSWLMKMDILVLDSKK